MSERSVQRYLELFHSTGSVDPKKPKPGPGELLNELVQFSILRYLIHSPKLQLQEFQEKLFQKTGSWASTSTICRTIKEHGFTRKKVQHIALQQSEDSRVKYMAEVSLFDPSMLIWINETGSDWRNEIRKFGYSLKGMQARYYQLRIGGKRLSAIPMMITNGIEDVYITDRSVNGDIFQHFFCVSFQYCYHLMVRTHVH